MHMVSQFSKSSQIYTPIRPKLFVEQKSVLVKMAAESVFTGTISVVNVGSDLLECYLIPNFDGVEFEDTYFNENNFVIHYRLIGQNIKNYQRGKQLVIKSNGGEETIPFQIELFHVVETDKDLDEKKRSEISEPIPIIQKNTKKKLVKCQLSKKSYFVNEQPIVSIQNFLSGQVMVTFFSKCKWLILPEPMLVDREINLKLEIELPPAYRWTHKWLAREPFIVGEVQVLLENEVYQKTLTLEIAIDLFNQESELTKRIKNEADYKKESVKIHRHVLESVIFETLEPYDNALKSIKRCLDFHPNDVYMRLLQIYLNIRDNNLNEAKKEVHYFIKYQHYYKEQLNIKLIVNWLNHQLDPREPFEFYEYDINDEYVWIIELLKYQETKELDYGNLWDKYNKGERNPYLMLFGFKYCQDKHYIPSKNDPYFTHIIKWAVRHDLFLINYVEVIDKYSLILYSTHNIDLNTMEYLYLKFESPNLLKLYTMLLIDENRLDMKAYQRYVDAKRQHLIVNRLDEYLVKACIANQIEEIKVDIVRHISIRDFSDELIAYLFYQYERNKEQLERQYLLLSHQLQQRVADMLEYGFSSEWLYKGAKYYLRNMSVSKLDQRQIAFLECIYTKYPNMDGIDFAILEIVRFYKQTQNYGHLIHLFSFEVFVKFKLIDEAICFLIDDGKLTMATNILTLIGLDKLLQKTREKFYQGIINNGAVADLRSFTEFILESESDTTVADYYFFSGAFSFKEMIELFNRYNRTTMDLSILCHRILDEAVYQNIFSTELQSVFIRYAKSPMPDYELLKQAENFLLFQIVINDAFIMSECVDIIRKLNEDEAINLPQAITFLKSHSEGLIVLEDDFLRLLVDFILEKGILFPWLANLVQDEALAKRINEKKFFEYHCIEDKRVFLCYRYDCESAYQTRELSPIGFGLYITSITVFFSEIVEYYIYEKDSNGNEVITLSDIYTHNRVTETNNRVDFFDMINTALMSRFYDDQMGMEEVVLQHITNQQIINGRFSVI